jgi:hypothetical protein
MQYCKDLDGFSFPTFENNVCDVPQNMDKCLRLSQAVPNMEGAASGKIK